MLAKHRVTLSNMIALAIFALAVCHEYRRTYLSDKRLFDPRAVIGDWLRK